MDTPITTRDVCRQLGLHESKLRHVLRRPGAPRPSLHPSVRLFLWTEADVRALERFLRREPTTPTPPDHRDQKVERDGVATATASSRRAGEGHVDSATSG